MPVYPPAFGSTSPALQNLFANEFAQRRAQAETDANLNATETARQQILAQQQLANAQLQAAQSDKEYNRLFREREFAAKEEGDKVREGQTDTALATDKAYREGLISGGGKTSVDAERRKQAITDANSAAVNDSQRANALYQINVDAAVAAAKKGLPMGAGLFGGTTAAQLDDPNHPARKLINKAAFDQVRSQLLAEKGGALNSLIPDAQTFTFKPVQYDETGKAIALPVPTPGAGAAQSAAGMQDNPAALGVPLTAPAAQGATQSSTGGAPAGMGDGASALFQMGAPVVTSAIGAMANMLGPNTGTASPMYGSDPTDTVPLPAPGGNGNVHVPRQAAIDLRMKLNAMPPEARAPFYQQYLQDAVNTKVGAFVPTAPAGDEQSGMGAYGY